MRNAYNEVSVQETKTSIWFTPKAHKWADRWDMIEAHRLSTFRVRKEKTLRTHRNPHSATRQWRIRHKS